MVASRVEAKSQAGAISDPEVDQLISVLSRALDSTPQDIPLGDLGKLPLVFSDLFVVSGAVEELRRELAVQDAERHVQHLLLELRLDDRLETKATLAAIAAVMISLILEHKGSDKPMAAFLGVRPSNGEVLVRLVSPHYATEKEVQCLLDQVFSGKTPSTSHKSSAEPPMTKFRRSFSRHLVMIDSFRCALLAGAIPVSTAAGVLAHLDLVDILRVVGPRSRQEELFDSPASSSEIMMLNAIETLLKRDRTVTGTGADLENEHRHIIYYLLQRGLRARSDKRVWVQEGSVLAFLLPACLQEALTCFTQACTRLSTSHEAVATSLEEHAARVLVQAFKRLPPKAVLPAAMLADLDRAEQRLVVGERSGASHAFKCSAEVFSLLRPLKRPSARSSCAVGDMKEKGSAGGLAGSGSTAAGVSTEQSASQSSSMPAASEKAADVSSRSYVSALVGGISNIAVSWSRWTRLSRTPEPAASTESSRRSANGGEKKTAWR